MYMVCPPCLGTDLGHYTEDTPTSLTAVRGAAGKELGGGSIAFLCQVNGHLDVLHPFLHL